MGLFDDLTPEQIRAITGESDVQTDDDKPATTYEVIRDKYSPGRDEWMDMAAVYVNEALYAWGDQNGLTEEVISSYWRAQGDHMLRNIENSLFRAADSKKRQAPAIIKSEIARGDALASEFGAAGMGRSYYMETADGINEMLSYALNWFGNANGIALKPAKRSSGRGRGSGGGRGGPTAEDIRKQFDIEELTRGVNDMNRNLVLEDHADPARIARAYVDAVVAGKGEQKIDFQTYVEQGIEKSARYKSIYKNKPESVTAQQYMAPYFQSALGVAPGDAAEIAIGGAQFGASSEQFQERLKRTDQVTGSAPYIRGLEDRLTELNSVLRG